MSRPRLFALLAAAGAAIAVASVALRAGETETSPPAPSAAPGAAPATPAAPEPWLAPAEIAEKANPIADTPEARAAAQAIYEKRCINCHGAEGKGDGFAASNFDVKPADLADPRIQEQTDGELHWKIATGRKPMPPFNDKLSDDDIWRSVLLVRHLARRTTGGEGPASSR